jgi:hypothetical protein
MVTAEVWFFSILGAIMGMILLGSCTGPPNGPAPGTADPAQPAAPAEREVPNSFYLPNDDGTWTPPSVHSSSLPAGVISVGIEGIGQFTVDAGQVETLRPDIFQPGHFSVFDALVQLDQQGDIELAYHFDRTMDTHVIDTINGESNWWYEAKYSGGWLERNVFRMDMYPVKDRTQIRLEQRNDKFLGGRYTSFKEEVARLAQNGGEVVIPQVTIGHIILTDVRVTPHNVRSDVLQPGVVTGLDLILSLADQGELRRLKLTWYESIGSRADPIGNYWVELIDFGDGFNDSEAFSTCGWVYETGPSSLKGFSGSHIHIPSDVRVTVSPEYAFWFWICL